jgi:uncharacterized repeat protein (TIGR03803 family)
VNDWTEQTLYDFSGIDGQQPSAGLILGSGGVLFGTTPFGGAKGKGVVFQVNP